MPPREGLRQRRSSPGSDPALNARRRDAREASKPAPIPPSSRAGSPKSQPNASGTRSSRPAARGRPASAETRSQPSPTSSPASRHGSRTPTHTTAPRSYARLVLRLTYDDTKRLVTAESRPDEIRTNGVSEGRGGPNTHTVQWRRRSEMTEPRLRQPPRSPLRPGSCLPLLHAGASETAPVPHDHARASIAVQDPRRRDLMRLRGAACQPSRYTRRPAVGYSDRMGRGDSGYVAAGVTPAGSASS